MSHDKDSNSEAFFKDLVTICGMKWKRVHQNDHNIFSVFLQWDYKLINKIQMIKTKLQQ